MLAAALLAAASPAAPASGALIGIESLGLQATADDEGRFLLAGIPAGRHSVSVSLLGYEALRLDDVVVRAGRATRLTLELRPAAIEVEPLVVEAERVPLIEPEVKESREVITGSTLRELPVVRTAEAVELATGISDGHFRGGQVGPGVLRRGRHGDQEPGRELDPGRRTRVLALVAPGDAETR